MKTRLTALAAAVSSLSMLTACGGGGGDGATGETPTYTPPAVTYYSTSAGLWSGTVGTRAVSGVVTLERAYWLVYNESSGPAPAGFYVGNATDNYDQPQDRSTQGVVSSAQVLRFDYEGDTVVREGTFTGTYPRTSITTKDKTESPYLNTNTLNGTFHALTGSIYDVTMSASNYFPGASGNLNMDGFTGVWDSASGQGSWTGTTTVVSFNAIMHYTQTFTMNVTTLLKPDGTLSTAPKEVAGAGGLNPLDLATCTDNDPQPGTSCNGFAGPLSGTWRNTAINPADKNTYKIPVPFTPVDGWTGQWTLSTQKILQDGTVEYNPVPMNVALHARPTTNSISNTVLTTTYNTLYEDEKPLMASIAGSYTSGWTGIAATRYADASLTIIADNSPDTPKNPLDGSFIGTEAASFCNYSGIITPHLTKGNLYDVSGLVFTNAAGGTCPYTSSAPDIEDREYKGVATYDAGKLTLTAINKAKDKGFMLVAIKP